MQRGKGGPKFWVNEKTNNPEDLSSAAPGEKMAQVVEEHIDAALDPFLQARDETRATIVEVDPKTMRPIAHDDFDEDALDDMPLSPNLLDPLPGGSTEPPPSEKRAGVSTTVQTTPRRSTRIAAKLPGLTPQRMHALREQVSKIRSWKVKKNDWALSLFIPFCEKMDVQPFPLDVETVKNFVTFLALDCELVFESIRNSLWPALIRLHAEHTKTDLEQIKIDQVNAHLVELSRTPDVVHEGAGKEPLIVADVVRIIDSIPDMDLMKARDASLFLFSVSTGARACSCESIRLKDIKSVGFDKQTQTDVVIINIPVGKNHPVWNHEVSLEGNFTQATPTNFVYWLDRHLRESHKISLKDLLDPRSKKPDLKASLWGLSRDAMRQSLKTRAELAGYPKERFGFHSLRSGMLCSALINADNDEESRRAIFEDTALVAAWKPGGAAQLRYAKQPLVRGIVASRLVGINLGPEHVSGKILKSDLATPEGFHGFELEVPHARPYFYTHRFKQELNDSLPKPKTTPAGLKTYRDAAMKSICYYFGKERLGSTVVGSDEHRANTIRAAGIEYITEAMSGDITILPDLIKHGKEMASKTLDKLFADAEKNFPAVQADPNAGREPAGAPIKMKRVRKEFTEEEEASLIEQVRAGASIGTLSLEGRDSKTVADHYKRMMLKSPPENPLPIPVPKHARKIPKRRAIDLKTLFQESKSTTDQLDASFENEKNLKRKQSQETQLPPTQVVESQLPDTQLEDTQVPETQLEDTEPDPYALCGLDLLEQLPGYGERMHGH